MTIPRTCLQFMVLIFVSTELNRFNIKKLLSCAKSSVIKLFLKKYEVTFFLVWNIVTAVSEGGRGSHKEREMYFWENKRLHFWCRISKEWAHIRKEVWTCGGRKAHLFLLKAPTSRPTAASTIQLERKFCHDCHKIAKNNQQICFSSKPQPVGQRLPLRYN